MNPTFSGSCSKPLFFNYIKSYIVYFKNTQKILRENLRFTRSSESKREFFGLNHRVLKFINYFCLIVNRFD